MRPVLPRLDVLWAGVIGWIVFDESLSAAMVGGGVLILSGGVMIAWHEIKAGRRPEKAGDAR